ncbi:hypothetical protein MRY87_09405 [bacterium]|nr:hypothetical protein [bacterium]
MTGSVESAESLFEEAVAARNEGNIDIALSKALRLLAETPESPRGRLLLANLFYLSGCLELAVEEVHRLAEKHPERPSLTRLLKTLDPTALLSTDKGEKKEEAPPDAEKDVQAGAERSKTAGPVDGQVSNRAGTGGANDHSSSGGAQATSREASATPKKKTPLAESPSSPKEDGVIAEADFDFEDFDLLQDD